MIGIDQFCGFGGSSEGAKMAGYNVAWAGNHWDIAIKTHELNNPKTEHSQEDVFLTNYYDDVPDFDFLMSSPACQGFSPANIHNGAGHDALRHLAWATVQCLDAKRPEWVIVENVPKFKRWGPEWNGETYKAWLKTIESLGYECEEHFLWATDSGVPQLRERLFIVGKLSEKPNLDFHKKTRKEALKDAPPIQDILEDVNTGWKHISKCAPGDRPRFAAGKEKCGSTFLSQRTTNHRGIPLDEPIRTITTQDHWFLVEGDYYRSLTLNELSAAMGFPTNHKIPQIGRTDAVIGLGNAVCPPVMRDILKQAFN